MIVQLGRLRALCIPQGWAAGMQAKAIPVPRDVPCPPAMLLAAAALRL